jgi:hypothetical protein
VIKYVLWYHNTRDTAGLPYRHHCLPLKMQVMVMMAVMAIIAVMVMVMVMAMMMVVLAMT